MVTPESDATGHTRENGDTPAGSGLAFGIARTRDDVIEAWELVYNSYLRAGLIPPNRLRIHAVPEAVRPTTAVIAGRIQGLTVSTMSCYLDAGGPLPLDLVYGPALRDLRDQGRRLMEAGLFADRREHIERSVNALLELMRYTFYYAVHSGSSDIIIGVNPHHAGFYEKCLGFERFADDAPCPHVNGAPMVPLRLDIPTKFNLDRLPRGLAFFKKHPLEPDAFAGRFSFAAAELAGSPIAELFAHRPTWCAA